MTAELTVDLDAVAANVRRLRAAATINGRGALLAVVKADGFGGGMEEVARCALAAGASGLGVTSLAEARRLREAGVDAPILSWLHAPDEDWTWALRHHVALGVPSLGHLAAITHAARGCGVPALVHLYADCGIARDGAPAYAWPELVARAQLAELAGNVRVQGVMGHLSSADTPTDERNHQEREAFAGAVAVARRAGLRPRQRHLAATAACLHDPAASHTVVRVGAGLVGIDPAGLVDLAQPLRFTTRVVSVRRVAAGAGVGYGHTWRAERETWLGLLPVGYADGVPRRLAAEAAVSLTGRRCRVVGRVSMDQTIIELGERPVATGSLVTIFGPGTDGEPTVADWARWADTIPHEIVTRIGPRVRREVVGVASPVGGPTSRWAS